MATLEFALRLRRDDETEVAAFPPLFVDAAVPSADSDAAEADEAVAVSERWFNATEEAVAESERRFDSEEEAAAASDRRFDEAEADAAEGRFNVMRSLTDSVSLSSEEESLLSSKKTSRRDRDARLASAAI